MTKQLQIRKGSRITIEARGRRITGTVTYVDYDRRVGYDIELIDANIAGGYSHWKQQFEGGRIVEVDGHEC